MAKAQIVLYREESVVPVRDWLASLPAKARAKCLVRLERLGELGHELRRPEADYLRDGIYELRASLSRVHYRMLYFFHGSAAVVISHGLTKEREVPPQEIERAVWRRAQYLRDPDRHSEREVF